VAPNRGAVTTGLVQIGDGTLTPVGEPPEVERGIRALVAAAQPDGKPWLISAPDIDGEVQRGFAQRLGERSERVAIFALANVYPKAKRRVRRQAWFAADPPRGIIHWDQRTFGARVSDGRHSRRKVVKSTMRVTTVASGKWKSRPESLPTYARVFVDASADSFVIVGASVDTIEVHWLDDDGAVIRKGSNKAGARKWVMETTLLMASGDVMFAGRASANSWDLIVGGISAAGKPLPIRELGPTKGLYRDGVALLACGLSAWLIHHAQVDSTHTYDAYRLADASPSPLRLWQGELGPARPDEMHTACSQNRAAFVVVDQRREDTVLLVEWKAD
jgi:hypothetical protein